MTIPRVERRQTLNSTEVAKLFGISRVTLNTWVKQGKVPEPLTDPATKQRIWTQADIEAVARYMERRKAGDD
jgi:DNA-binding transcriptional MerR regulator